MKMIDALLAEMDQEAQATARVLERVPQSTVSPRPANCSAGSTINK